MVATQQSSLAVTSNVFEGGLCRWVGVVTVGYRHKLRLHAPYKLLLHVPWTSRGSFEEPLGVQHVARAWRKAPERRLGDRAWL